MCFRVMFQFFETQNMTLEVTCFYYVISKSSFHTKYEGGGGGGGGDPMLNMNTNNLELDRSKAE